MQRVIKLSKFRNFGLENEETLILNQSLSKGEMGDLVIVIGPNNSGKSNILDAISLLQEDRALSDRDITTLSFDEEHRKPHVSLGIRGRADEISIYYSIAAKNSDIILDSISCNMCITTSKRFCK